MIAGRDADADVRGFEEFVEMVIDLAARDRNGTRSACGPGFCFSKALRMTSHPMKDFPVAVGPYIR
jgi:hypothetical protein